MKNKLLLAIILLSTTSSVYPYYYFSPSFIKKCAVVALAAVGSVSGYSECVCFPRVGSDGGISKVECNYNTDSPGKAECYDTYVNHAYKGPKVFNKDTKGPCCTAQSFPYNVDTGDPIGHTKPPYK